MLRHSELHIIEALNARAASYVVVGGTALHLMGMFHRSRDDLDILIAGDEENRRHVFSAIWSIVPTAGASLRALVGHSDDRFRARIPIAPDEHMVVLTALDGVDTGEVLARAVSVYMSANIRVIAMQDLLAVKLATAAKGEPDADKHRQDAQRIRQLMMMTGDAT